MHVAQLLSILAVAVFVAAGSVHASEFAPRVSAATGYHFSSGKYGSSESTEIGYVPLVLKAQTTTLNLQLTIPYLSINGPAGFVVGPGGAIQTVNGETDGLGDVLARAAYTFAPRDPRMPWIDLIGRIKFPTASRSQGLGTGEFDYGVELDLAWSVDRFTPFLGGGYHVLGSPPGSDLENVFVASAGGVYRLVDRLNTGIFLDYRESPLPSAGQRLDLIPFGSWKATDSWSVDTYVSAGLASGSPDVGVGLQLTYSLPPIDAFLPQAK